MTSNENGNDPIESKETFENLDLKTESTDSTAKNSQNEIDANNKEKTAKKEEITLRNVLVIDDSDALRRVLIKYLQVKFYCNLFESENGQAALKIVNAKKGQIDLILCDLMMPVLDGFSFLGKLKENSEHSKIPIIFLTSKNDKDTVTKCIALGANDFIVKPYELSSVSKKISKYLMPRSNITI